MKKKPAQLSDEEVEERILAERPSYADLPEILTAAQAAEFLDTNKQALALVRHQNKGGKQPIPYTKAFGVKYTKLACARYWLAHTVGLVSR